MFDREEFDQNKGRMILLTTTLGVAIVLSGCSTFSQKNQNDYSYNTNNYNFFHISHFCRGDSNLPDTHSCPDCLLESYRSLHKFQHHRSTHRTKSGLF